MKKQYLLSVYQPDGDPPPPEILDGIMRNVRAVGQEMKDAGAWVFTAGLNAASAATVVRVQDGKPLITDGLFGRIRHPIYAFSILLVLCTVAVVPTALMAACGAALVAMWVVKAHNEERKMLRQHGDAYAAYLARTGRFVPRIS